MAITFQSRPSRRDILRAGGAAAGLTLIGGWPWRNNQATARLIAAPKRFLQINLDGGWDSALATDPVVLAKRDAGGYQSDYAQSAALAPTTVPGKSKLVVGAGLAPAISAFASMPTAFVNGIYNEISAHEFAAQYISSGKISLTNTRDYPAIPAMLGSTLAGFPPHVVLGKAIPMGETRYTSPPLHAASIEALNTMIGGPSGSSLPDDGLFHSELIGDAQELIDGLDAHTYNQLPAEHQRDLASWRAGSGKVQSIYNRKLGGQLVLTKEIKDRYRITSDSGPEVDLASVFTLMKSNLCPYVTTGVLGFDHHADHLLHHVPLMKRFAAALAVLVQDLLKTDDPLAPGKKLAETTTIYITSEMVRTPKFNIMGGTDHWPAFAAILMGQGVTDNVVIGATDNQAYALGWQGNGPVTFSEKSALLPDHLIATILSYMGTQEQANSVSEVRLNGLFA